MIILDRNLNNPAILEGLRQRLHVGVRVVEPDNLSDEDLYHRLARERNCVFVTHNRKDFWEQFEGHPQYCILCVEDMEVSQVEVIIDTLARALHTPLLRQTRARNGLVARANPVRMEWYRRRNESRHRLIFPR